MAYSDITFKDRNHIKRWLQQRRLVAATRIAEGRLVPRRILDFGAGNGELCKLLSSRFPDAIILCYEPTQFLMAEARENLADIPGIQFHADIADIADRSVELIFCLEVFEHLPSAETEAALGQFARVMSEEGSAIIGVPVEIGIPAIYKGIFRMSRRFGAFDASIKHVLLSALGRPPRPRPVSEIAPGFAFHYEHMGFDYRDLQALLRTRFRLRKVTRFPDGLCGPWICPEVNFLVSNANPALSAEAARVNPARRRTRSIPHPLGIPER